MSQSKRMLVQLQTYKKDLVVFQLEGKPSCISMFFLSRTISSPMFFLGMPKVMRSCLLAAIISLILASSCSMQFLSFLSQLVQMAVICISLLLQILELKFTQRTRLLRSLYFFSAVSVLFFCCQISSFRNLFSTRNSIFYFSFYCLFIFQLSRSSLAYSTSVYNSFFYYLNCQISSLSSQTYFWWAIFSISFSFSSFFTAVLQRCTSCCSPSTWVLSLLIMASQLVSGLLSCQERGIKMLRFDFWSIQICYYSIFILARSPVYYLLGSSVILRFLKLRKFFMSQIKIITMKDLSQQKFIFVQLTSENVVGQSIRELVHAIMHGQEQAKLTKYGSSSVTDVSQTSN